jgi:5-methyltetrahydrofolate--homocysteine methyltransferase
MNDMEAIFKAVVEGNESETQAAVEAALQNGIPAAEIMQRGLIAAMAEVGRLFETCEYYVPEMLIAARAMQAGLAMLKPQLVQSDVKAAGRVVVGTVKGDLHDIGKNLVAMMLQGAGFEVVDLGTDVPPEKFVAEVQSGNVDLISLSALLTTTMPSMADTIRALQTAGVRDKVKVIVGGAPVTESYATQIGADGYGPDASVAVRLAKSLVQNKVP